MIKVQTGKFLEFINKMTLNGKINDVLLNFEEAGLRVWCKSIDSSTAVLGLLNKEVFTEYEICSIGIIDVNLFLKVLKNCGDVLSLGVVDDKLQVVSGKVNAKLCLGTTETINSVLPSNPSISYENEARIKTDVFKQAKTNTEILGDETLRVEVKNNKLMINVGEDKFNVLTCEESFEYSNFVSEYREPLLCVINVLGGEVLLSAKTDYPIRLVEKDNEKSITYYTAPIIQND